MYVCVYVCVRVYDVCIVLYIYVYAIIRQQRAPRRHSFAYTEYILVWSITAQKILYPYIIHTYIYIHVYIYIYQMNVFVCERERASKCVRKCVCVCVCVCPCVCNCVCFCVCV